MLAQQQISAIPVAIADPELLDERAAQLNIKIRLETFSTDAPPPAHEPGTLFVMPESLYARVTPGTPAPDNADYVLSCLRTAVNKCVNKTFHAMVTGPIHKGIINEAGIPFSGHTEYLGALTGSYPVMMLVSDKLRVALATTHLPLSAVSQAITPELLTKTLKIIHRDLKKTFGLTNPRIIVAGLNPHAGENGYLGTEDINIIKPVIEDLRASGMQISGPAAADSLFASKNLSQYDAVLAMYHDQGLPVIKYASFGTAVNITLGLPIIRTSVDHGTALELAGSGQAHSSSLQAAFELACTLRSH